jgi:hypothetical protein
MGNTQDLKQAPLPRAAEADTLAKLEALLLWNAGLERDSKKVSQLDLRQVSRFTGAYAATVSLIQSATPMV